MGLVTLKTIEIEDSSIMLYTTDQMKLSDFAKSKRREGVSIKIYM